MGVLPLQLRQEVALEESFSLPAGEEGQNRKVKQER